MTPELDRELAPLVVSDTPLPAIVEHLRDLGRRGVSRQEVYAFHETLSENARDEAIEDRILEVMDFVSGFCSPDWTIWTD